MGLETVISEVEEGGKRRAQAVLDEAQAKAGELIAEATDKASKYEAERASQADKDAAQLRAQMISHAEFEARKAVLQAEADLRRKLRAAVIDGFAGFSKPLRGSHLDRLVKNAREIVPSGKVWGSEKDKAYLENVDGYKFAGKADIAGGLIVEDAKGTVRVDLSYEALLDGLWRDILRQEADLFK